jgi:hypothetical protein
MGWTLCLWGNRYDHGFQVIADLLGHQSRPQVVAASIYIYHDMPHTVQEQSSHSDVFVGVERVMSGARSEARTLSFKSDVKPRLEEHIRIRDHRPTIITALLVSVHDRMMSIAWIA